MVKRNGGRKVSAVCAIARRLVPLLLHVAQSGEAWNEAKWRRDRHAAGHAEPVLEAAMA
jgi:hypothetical protein